MIQPENDHPLNRPFTAEEIIALPRPPLEVLDSSAKSNALQGRAGWVARKFVQRIVTGNRAGMAACLTDLNEGDDGPGGGWFGVMCLVSERRSVPRVARDLFLKVFIGDGDFLRDKCADDRVFSDGLRVLLPKYRGPAMRLYRGETSNNLSQLTYGVSWSASPDPGRVFAENTLRRSFGGTVLLETIASREAIISRVPKSIDRMTEEEYIVDPRCLTSVKVIERFAEVKPRAKV